MSDLSATNCGCGCDDGRRGNGCGCGNDCGFANNSCLWIILLLICCGGYGNGCGGYGNDSCLWIILLLICCGGLGNGCGGCEAVAMTAVSSHLSKQLRRLFYKVKMREIRLNLPRSIFLLSHI